MFSRIFLAILMGLAALPLFACSSVFTLAWNANDEYVLTPPAGKEGAVYAYLDGGKDMALVKVIEIECPDGEYALPVLKTEVGTGIYSAVTLEYFVFKLKDGNYSPIKSMVSVRSVDRETGVLITDHVFDPAAEMSGSNFCQSISQENEFDRAIQAAFTGGKEN